MTTHTGGETTRRPTILHVEDDASKRYALTRNLEHAGFTVREACTGEEAFRILASLPTYPDLVILDVNLPDMNGFEVCRRIKADPEMAVIPVIQISTVFTASQDRVHGLEGGADAYLTGSTPIEEVIATVRAVLRRTVAAGAAPPLIQEAVFFRTLVDTVGDGIWAVNPEGRTTYVNIHLAELLGYIPGEMLGRFFVDFIYPEDADRSLEYFERRRQGHPDRYEIRLGRRDGTPVWVNCSARALTDPRGGFAGSVATIADLTAQKKAEQERAELAVQAQRTAEELATAYRRKDEFLAVLAHELRNPLATISNAAYLLTQAGDAELPRLGERIERQTGRVIALVDDLLDLSRIGQGKLRLRLSQVALAQVLAAALETVEAEIRMREHSLTLALATEDLVVEGDALRLEQCVGNLLSNASRYSPVGGQIHVELLRAGSQAVVRVTDNGQGLDAELLPLLFDLFAQGEPDDAQPAGGLGIGLHLVRRLMELHGGTVQAASPGPGQGSTFTLSLPLLLQPA